MSPTRCESCKYQADQCLQCALVDDQIKLDGMTPEKKAQAGTDGKWPGRIRISPLGPSGKILNEECFVYADDGVPSNPCYVLETQLTALKKEFNELSDVHVNLMCNKMELVEGELKDQLIAATGKIKILFEALHDCEHTLRYPEEQGWVKESLRIAQEALARVKI